MMILQIEHIYKKFGENIVFDDFSMQVDEREFIVIEGESGSGKSTLLNMIGLLERPDKGDIILFGDKNVRPFSKTSEKLLKYKIGYLFQNFALVEDKSVMYNMEMAIEHYKVKNRKEKIQEALAKVGLAGYETKKVFECSGGEQQRIAIARLLLKPCELILADEPTGSLDVDNKHKIFLLLKDLQKQGKTIVIVTHDPDLMEIADRVVKLQKKR